MFKSLTYIIFFFTFLTVRGYAQVNLVVNPSFEIYTACPDNTGGDVYKATGWDTCRGTPDYFNTCATFNYFQIPTNTFGYQNAAYGTAYCGLYTYDAGSFYRECIIGSLTTPLTISQKYFVSFKVSCADSNFFISYATNKLGVKMSTTIQSNVAINNSAHFYTNAIISDTAGWTRLSGFFIADSTYQYIMLGNFFDDTNTSTLNFQSGNIGYYYIDEVCLSTDSLYSLNYATGLNEINPLNEVAIYPNPAINIFQINGLGQKSWDIKIFDSLGREIITEVAKQTEVSIDCSKWTSGLYIIQTQNLFHKIIINH